MTYIAPTVPADEAERLAELRALDILDTEADEAFDSLTRLAAYIAGTPIALVSLIDAERQWFKSRVGLEARETSRDISFCGHAILDPDRLFVVPDTMQDARFRENPLVVNDPGIRFYAGAPLKTGAGSAIGTLCVIDRVPRNLSNEQCEALSTLSLTVVAQLNLRQRLSRANEYLSFYDVATGLPNGIALGKQFAARAPQLRQGCLLLVAVKRLNEIRANGGIDAVDAILKQAARRLSAVAPPEAILASVSRGLFGLLLPAVDPAFCSRWVTQHLVVALQAPYVLHDHEFHCPFFLGAAFFPDDGSTYDDLFRAAQQALNSAQANQEILHFYNDSMGQAMTRQLQLERELRQAIDLGQLINFYQPKIDLASGKIVGAEALMRWQHPERGLVSPAEFIPVLESSGLIVEAGRHALSLAMHDWCIWHDAGLNAPRIAVNVSPLQLRRETLRDDIEATLKANGDNPQALSIEITESSLMDNREVVTELLGTLRERGITIAIDDFGTGYSSLAYLVTLPVDVLKIDIAFIRKMTIHPAYLGLVTTIITLAHNLNLSVVAEGVETEEQAKLLRLLRCDEAQGYLYGKPVTAEDFAQLLTAA